MRPFLCLACSTVLLPECGDRADEQEDRIEAAAGASAAEAGPEPAALGLSEAQLLEADLIDANRIDLGSGESVIRNAAGEVERLLVEIKETNPDRFVEVAVDGLAATLLGGDTDLLIQGKVLRRSPESTTHSRRSAVTRSLGADIPLPGLRQMAANYRDGWETVIQVGVEPCPVWVRLVEASKSISRCAISRSPMTTWLTPRRVRCATSSSE